MIQYYYINTYLQTNFCFINFTFGYIVIFELHTINIFRYIYTYIVFQIFEYLFGADFGLILVFQI